MRGRVCVAVISMAPAGCGGAAVADGGGGAHAARYAREPTQAGMVNRSAIPLGDGYLSTSPTVGYVDSCITHVTGGGASREGPWIHSRAGTWSSETKLAVSGRVSWPQASYNMTIDGGGE